jgi:hypothetical protein
MSATITWVIEWMQTTPTTATPPETVITAGWRCNGAETANAVDYTTTPTAPHLSPLLKARLPLTPIDSRSSLGLVLGKWC